MQSNIELLKAYDGGIIYRHGQGSKNKLSEWHHNTKHNDTQHNDTQRNDTQHKDTQHNDTQYSINK